MMENQQNHIGLKEFSRFFDMSLDMLCIAGADGYFKMLNPVWERNLGYNTRELLDRPFLDFIHPDDHEKTRNELGKLKEGGVTLGFENRYVAVDGKTGWLMWSANFDKEQKLYYAIAREITEQKEAEARMLHDKALLETIRQVQTQYITDVSPRIIFENFLSRLLALTGSEYGFIGEVNQSLDGRPYLKTYALSNIAWNEETMHLYEQSADKGMEFHNLKTLFGEVMTTGKPVIANDPANDPRSGGLPAGHPPLKAFLGLPIYAGSNLVGMVGIANRGGGYDETLVEFLQPLLATSSQLISALRVDQLRQQAVTDQQDKQARLESILDTVVDGIITINDRGIVASFNPAAVRIFGYGPTEVIGRNVNMLMPSPYREAHDTYLNNYLDTGDAKIIGIGREVVGRRKDGETFPMDLAVSEMWIGDQRMFTGIVRDITDRKRMERMTNEFVSSVSHELRTPLTSIRGSLGLVAGEAAGPLPEKAKTLVDIACNNCDRLIRLINDILDIEKMASGKMEYKFSSMEILPLIEHVIEANNTLAQAQDVELAMCDTLPGVWVKGDADRLNQVLTNLISNAIKFSPKKARIELGMAFESGHVRVSVRDHGPGISEEFRDRIFQKFAQADSSDSRAKGGTGLGLSICKAIVERHGGKIYFESMPDGGTCFYVEIPAWLGSEPAPVGMDAQPDRRGCILICEDDLDVANLLRFMLDLAGFDSFIAHDAKGARSALASRHFDAMTLDLMLPDENGMTLIRELRDQPATADLPIIVVSAVADEHKHELAGSAVNVVDWLAKPVDERRLITVVHAAVGDRNSDLPHILHVEDDSDVVQVVRSVLDGVAIVETATTLHEARERMRHARFDLVILDVALPDGDGAELLPAVDQTGLPVPVIVFSASEVGSDIARQVSSVLIKSRTSNENLIKALKSAIRQRSKH